MASRRPVKSPQGTSSSRNQKRVTEALLDWFNRERRDLPWRRTGDPYAIWVSEVMLQQTRVDTAHDYFVRWMDALPTLVHLAEAPEARVLELWQGLGYYSRARRLREGARYVLAQHQGKLPSSLEGLLEIPGIGPYSAGAIASIAFGKPEPAIDGNVIRVISRLFCIPGAPATQAHRREVERCVRELMPTDRPGDYNQALMELGATVCTPKTPLCASCPLLRSCEALREGRVGELPERPRRVAPTKITAWVFIAEHGRRIEVQDLSPNARWWAGLSALPTLEAGSGSGGAMLELDPSEGAMGSVGLEGGAEVSEVLGRLGFDQGGYRVFDPVLHQVTRYRLNFLPVIVKARGRRLAPRARLVDPKELAQSAMPAPFRKILDAYLAMRLVRARKHDGL